MTPQKLGRYEILGELGKGAMGVVYLAKDPIIGRKVALKTFRIGLSSRDQEFEQFRARFLREAQSAGILNHPNIVTIHDVVEDAETSAFFIAMEYVKGTDLKLLMQRHNRLDLAFVIDLVAQVADGLDYAHQQGVVHRDIKPANVIITAEKQAKITDFGIARMDASNLTVEGQLLGTPNYMAPEQVQGKDVDHRADLFSLGVMLYEMLTGHKPFAGENLTVVTHRIVYDTFTPPEEFVDTLPAPLMAILDRALKKDVAERYPRGKDLAEELRAALAPAPSLQSTAPANPGIGSYLPQAAPAETSGSSLTQPGAGASAAAEPFSEPSTTTAAVEGPKSGKSGWPIWQRMTLIALLTLGIGLGVGKLAQSFFIAEDPVVSFAPKPAFEQELRTLPDIREGQRLLEAGDPVGALAAFERALEIRPRDPDVLRLRDEAERQAVDVESSDLEQSFIRRRLENAELAISRRDYLRALDLADEILGVDPKHKATLELRARAEKGLERKRQAQARLASGAGSRPSPTSGSPEPTSDGGVASNRPAEPSMAELNVVLESQISEGKLTIYLGQKPLLQESFRFVEKRGVLRSRKTSGSLRGLVRVPAEKVKLRIYVWRKVGKDSAAKIAEVEGDFSSGSPRTLQLSLDAEGDLRASLK